MPIKFGLWLDEDDDYQITNLKSAWVLGKTETNLLENLRKFLLWFMLVL